MLYNSIFEPVKTKVCHLVSIISGKLVQGHVKSFVDVVQLNCDHVQLKSWVIIIYLEIKHLEHNNIWIYRSSFDGIVYVPSQVFCHWSPSSTYTRWWGMQMLMMLLWRVFCLSSTFASWRMLEWMPLLLKMDVTR